MIQLVSLLLNLITTIVGEALQLCIDAGLAIVPSQRKKQYDAKFGKVGDVLPKNERGFSVTGKRFLSVEDSFSHMVCFGGSGSGKSNSLIIPTVLRAENVSLVIHDSAKETLPKTAPALHRKGYNILVLDYNSPHASEGFNVLTNCTSFSDVHKVAVILVKNALGNSPEAFWNTSAEALIALFGTYLIKYAEPQYRTLFQVLTLVQQFSYAPEKIDKLIIKSGDEQLINQYKTFVAYPDKTLMSVVATATTALSIFSSESLAKVTSFHSIDFEEFRKRPTALYICSSAKDAE